MKIIMGLLYYREEKYGFVLMDAFLGRISNHIGLKQTDDGPVYDPRF
jgi:hypothetical protein